jgi:hypothetical protein
MAVAALRLPRRSFLAQAGERSESCLHRGHGPRLQKKARILEALFQVSLPANTGRHTDELTLKINSPGSFSSLRRLLLAPLTAIMLAPSAILAQDMLTYHGDPIPANIEAMYVKGLKSLVKTQAEDGSWPDQQGKDHGVVGLAILAILAHGDDPNSGPYSSTVKKSLNYILKAQRNDNGYIGSSMYNHGFATLALAEAYGNVNDDRIGPALKKAVALILTSQASNPYGGWRYSPESRDADTTVSGAQMVALIAARNAGIAVPDKALSTALRFYRQCQGGDGGFGYTNPGGSSAPQAAIGVLVFGLARQKNIPEFKAGVRYLQQVEDSNISSGYQHYFMYYAAQAYFHADMELWKKWSKRNVEYLASSQDPNGGWNGSHGPTFCTSASLLSLALNYRLLPIYER